MIAIGVINTAGTATTTDSPKVVTALEKSAAAPDKQRQDMPLSGKVLPVEGGSEAREQETLRAVVIVSEFTQSASRDLEFKVDGSSGISIVTVRDRETDEVIRQMPSEEVVAMARFIAEQAPDSAVGLLMDEEG
ncbi:MAG: flagellar protein FlaG [Halioglobus sp.]|jgi:flagellar protein FlaG